MTALAAAPPLARCTMPTPIGPLTLVASPVGLRAVLWPGEDGTRVRRALVHPAEGGVADASAVHLDDAQAQLAQYFAGDRRAFDLVLDVVGTPFQLRAWQALVRIPYGQTMSYGQQAAALGNPGSARAVGAANGRNPLSIVVPCHRVVSAAGSLTGFAGGMDTKAWLLAHEARVLATGPSTPGLPFDDPPGGQAGAGQRPDAG